MLNATKHPGLTRRTFLRRSSLALAGSVLLEGRTALAAAAPRLRIGLLTDLHYADKPPRGRRYYRETLDKFAEAAGQFAKDRCDLVVELGDLIDSAETLEEEKGYLRRIVKEFSAVAGRRCYVLGNHCVYNLTKPEFLEIVGQKASFFSFDLNDVHLVVLDACFRADGQAYGRKNFDWQDSNIPRAELEWLRADLAKTAHKTLVFIHQRLDEKPPIGVANAPQVRKILEESQKVLAVFQGHHHQNECREIGGIRYCTLRGMIEGSGKQNNAYARLDVLPGDALRLTGFGKQSSYEWKRNRSRPVVAHKSEPHGSSRGDTRQ